MMESVKSLLHYSCVCRGSKIIAHHQENLTDEELQKVASECIESIPPYHIRFNHTAKKKRYAFLINDEFVLFSISDEALPKTRVYEFLEHALEEISRVSKDGSDEAMEKDMGYILKSLSAPLIGIPLELRNATPNEHHTGDSQDFEEVCSPTPSAPLYDSKANHNASSQDNNNKKEQKKTSSLCNFIPKKKKTVKEEIVTREVNNGGGNYKHKGQKIEVMVDGVGNSNSDCGSSGALNLQSEDAGNSRSKGQQLAQRMWWRNVRVVLLLDVAVCCILFAVWLGICNGFHCISD